MRRQYCPDPPLLAPEALPASDSNSKDLLVEGIPGGIGTGETTLTNVIAGYIPDIDRILHPRANSIDLGKLRFYRKRTVLVLGSSLRPREIVGRGNDLANLGQQLFIRLQSQRFVSTIELRNICQPH